MEIKCFLKAGGMRASASEIGVGVEKTTRSLCELKCGGDSVWDEKITGGGII